MFLVSILSFFLISCFFSISCSFHVFPFFIVQFSFAFSYFLSQLTPFFIPDSQAWDWQMEVLKGAGKVGVVLWLHALRGQW
jgi:hypothetical protein